MATFSPKKHSYNKRYCCVPQCNSIAVKQRECSFHTFPKSGEIVKIVNAYGIEEKVDRRREWAKVLRMGKDITKTMTVCSKHFLRGDYLLSDISAKHRFLKKNAVPSQNLPVCSTTTRPTASTSTEPSKRRDRHMKRCHSSQTQVTPLGLGIVDDTEMQDVADRPTADVEAAEALITLLATNTQDPRRMPGNHLRERNGPSVGVGVQVGCGMSETRDVGTQVCSGDFACSMVNIIDTEKKLRVTTGIQSFLLFNTLLEIFSSFSPESNRHSMNNRKKILLTFVKLKLNWSFVILSMMFGGTAGTCSNIFKTTLVTLATFLQASIHWPSKLEVVSNMPKCFQKYKNVRIVLDCTEIATFKSKCLKCRIMSYSFYKGGQTVKYLIGVSPAGMITYLSKGFGGRASDKAIFLDSDLIGKLDSYVDSVMIDKGFLIKDICDQFGIGLICPPFLRKKKQFSKEEALATCDIAKARVHVERAIERVKKFKIASERIPWKLLEMVDPIMVVLCAMANLSSPILADDKF